MHTNAIKLLSTDSVVHCMHYWLAALLGVVLEYIRTPNSAGIARALKFSGSFVQIKMSYANFVIAAQIATISGAVLAW